MSCALASRFRSASLSILPAIGLMLTFCLTPLSATADDWGQARERFLQVLPPREGDCSKAWAILLPWVEAGNVEAAELAGSVWLSHGLAPAGITRSEKSLPLIRYLLIMSLYGGQASEPESLDFAKGAVSVYGGSKPAWQAIAKCLDTEGEKGQCWLRAEKRHLIPPISTYVAELRRLAKTAGTGVRCTAINGG